MPAGSGSLALLFKIDADTAEARAAFQQLLASQNQLVQGVLDGMRAEAQSALNTIKDLSERQRGILEGIVTASTTAQKQIAEGSKNTTDQMSEGFKKASTNVKELDDSSKQLGVTFNQVRNAVAALLGGLTLRKAFNEISEAIADIGTRSKEDFDELQKRVESAGGHITELQRQLSRGVVDALDQVKGASTGFMAEVIEKSAPALINLLKQIAQWLVDLRPLAKAVGDDFADTFNRLNAIGRTIIELHQRQAVQQPGIGETILEGLFPPLAAKRAMDDMKTFDEAYARHLKNVTAENEKFKPKDAPFDPKKVKQTKQGLAELAQAMADFDEAQRLANEERQRIAIDEAHGVIDRDQAASQLVDIEERLFQAEKKRIEAERDVALKNAKTADARAAANIKAENAIANARTQTDIKTSQLFEKRDKENQAADEKLISEAIEEDKKERKLIEDRNEFRIKSEIETQKAIAAINAEDVKAPGQTTVGQDIISDIHDTVTALDPATKAWREAKLALDDYLQSVQQGKADLSQMPQILDQMVQGLIQQSVQLVLAGNAWQGLGLLITKALPLAFLAEFTKQIHKMTDAFIETGKTGPAVFKQLVAGTLRALGEMASQWAAFMFALAIGYAALGDWGQAALATAAGIGFEAVAIALGFLAGKISPKQGGATSAAATQVQPPNTTINIGGTAQLGGTPGDLFGAVIASNNQNTAAITQLHEKIGSMNPGDVVTVAAQTSPQSFATGVTNATKQNSSFVRALGLTLQPT
jgi:hypothetical protein